MKHCTLCTISDSPQENQLSAISISYLGTIADQTMANWDHWDSPSSILMDKQPHCKSHL